MLPELSKEVRRATPSAGFPSFGSGSGLATTSRMDTAPEITCRGAHLARVSNDALFALQHAQPS
eukprot:2901387-Alexandrium_andersonii.AAC.1